MINLHMRAYCDGCGRMRTICMTINPRGIVRISENGERIIPVRERFCEECGRIRMKRIVEWGLKE